MKSSSEQNERKVAIVTGVTGQDGSYLSEFLLDKGYEVIGVARRSSTDTHLYRIEGLIGREGFKVVQGDVTDEGNMFSLLAEYQPDEFYNLAAQSHVKTSFEQPVLTYRVNALGVLNILEAIRHRSPHTRFYQASTSEMFGRSYSAEIPVHEFDILEHFNKDEYSIEQLHKDHGDDVIAFQGENTPFEPQSPYSVAKAAAHYNVQLYRRAYGLHASCGILFNHESERRGELFVTRKITKWVGEFVTWLDNRDIDLIDEDFIHVGCDKFPKLMLGTLDSKRDWGHAADYVRAMWTVLQQDEPDDYVVSMMETHSVRDFLTEAFGHIGMNYDAFVGQDPRFMRPAEVSYLLGNSNKFRETTDWEPEITFKQLVQRMVDHDTKEAQKKQLLSTNPI
jgi:GDPmannose 4,6-dehydratase